MQAQYHNRVGVVRWIFSILVLLAALWIFFNRQTVLDEINLRTFEPTQEVLTLAEDTTLTQLGERYFFASMPRVEDRASFNQHCKTLDEQSIILGCYTGQRIYLYNVTEERLAGVKQVTAAHEMLHAAYDRLNSKDLSRINRLLDEESKSITDPRLVSLIESYRKADPSQVNNELHSIIGTEVRDISEELETYYSKYFTNRGNIIDYAEDYEKVFAELKTKQAQLTGRLNELDSLYKSRIENYNVSVQRLNSEIITFNKRAENGDFDSQDEFNTERSRLVAAQESIRSERTEINNLITEFNNIREELLALGVQAENLNNALDSTPDEVRSL